MIRARSVLVLTLCVLLLLGAPAAIGAGSLHLGDGVVTVHVRTGTVGGSFGSHEWARVPSVRVAVSPAEGASTIVMARFSALTSCSTVARVNARSWCMVRVRVHQPGTEGFFAQPFNPDQQAGATMDSGTGAVDAGEDLKETHAIDRSAVISGEELWYVDVEYKLGPNATEFVIDDWSLTVQTSPEITFG